MIHQACSKVRRWVSVSARTVLAVKALLPPTIASNAAAIALIIVLSNAVWAMAAPIKIQRIVVKTTTVDVTQMLAGKSKERNDHVTQHPSRLHQRIVPGLWIDKDREFSIQRSGSPTGPGSARSVINIIKARNSSTPRASASNRFIVSSRSIAAFDRNQSLCSHCFGVPWRLRRYSPSRRTSASILEAVLKGPEKASPNEQQISCAKLLQ